MCVACSAGKERTGMILYEAGLNAFKAEKQVPFLL
jgi:hypothetical protein